MSSIGVAERSGAPRPGVPPLRISEGGSFAEYVAVRATKLTRKPANLTHQYVTAIIKVRSRKLIVIDTNGEIIHHSDFNLSRELR